MSESLTFSSRVAQAYQTFEDIEDSLDTFVSANSTLVEHVTENWAAGVTLGFWTKLLRIRQKQIAMRKLTAKYLRAILSVHTPFVMNVATVKTWRDSAESVFVKISDPDIRVLYNAIISLKHDPDFLEPLRRHNEFLYHYFLDKVSYIERNLDQFDGREISGPLTYPLLTDLFSVNQGQIQTKLLEAANLGNPPGPADEEQTEDEENDE